MINNGYVMVDLFFVLSGFVIYRAYHGRINSGKELLKFQLLRLGRLYPVHILFLLVFLIFEFGKYLAATKLGIVSPNSTPFANNDFVAFIKNLFLVQAVFPNQTLTFNNPAWSISVEFYTYFIFALLIWVFSRYVKFIFPIISMVAFLLLMTSSTYGFDYLLRCLSGFFAGCFVVQVIGYKSIELPKFAPTLPFISIILYMHLKPFGEMDLYIVPLTMVLIITMLQARDSKFKALFRHRFLVFFGKISYSIYMSHLAVIWVTTQFFRVALNKSEVIGHNGKSVSVLSPLETILAISFVFGSVILLSLIVYNVVEKPFRTATRALLKNW